jgi:hypothetical protein
VDDVALANLVAGSDFRPVYVGAADHPIAGALRVRVGTPIWLSDYTFNKIKFRHSELSFADYKTIPYIMMDGFVVLGKYRKSVDIYYIDSFALKFKSWRLSIKRTTRGELYVATFHRSNRGAMRGAMRRTEKNGTLVRSVAREMARRLERRAR